LKFAIYSRKSVYTGKGESIENQIEMCRQYIFTKFDDTSDADIEIYEDEGFSAKNTDRPQFKRLISDINTMAEPFRNVLHIPAFRQE
jgi:site-specific DNA recombinase